MEKSLDHGEPSIPVPQEDPNACDITVTIVHLLDIW